MYLRSSKGGPAEPKIVSKGNEALNVNYIFLFLDVN